MPHAHNSQRTKTTFAVMNLLHKVIDGTTIVAVGHHNGTEDTSDDTVKPDIIRHLSPRKRAEWIASRELLYQIAELPAHVSCLYDDFGKPYLEGIDRHISVSHSGAWCSAMISDRPCGTDIQIYTDTVIRIAGRFLTEQDLLSVEHAKKPLYRLHLLWGAKECIYKAYGKRQLGFREHIFVRYIDAEKGTGKGEILYEDLHLSYDIYFRMLPEAAWIFCVERADGPPPGRRSV